MTVWGVKGVESSPHGKKGRRNWDTFFPFWHNPRETALLAFGKEICGACTSPLIIFQYSVEQLMSIFSAPKKILI
jgi:hypothetical protein